MAIFKYAKIKTTERYPIDLDIIDLNICELNESLHIRVFTATDLHKEFVIDGFYFRHNYERYTLFDETNTLKKIKELFNINDEYF